MKHKELTQRDFNTYDDMVDSWGYESLATDFIGDYQGDIFYLLKNNDEYSILDIGYGSCSGCDALEACDTREDRIELAESIKSSMKWFSKKDLLDHLNVEYLETQYFYYQTDAKEIIEKYKGILNGL